jgi:ABC-type multidrug transport system fused ATPase/permease subunit
MQNTIYRGLCLVCLLFLLPLGSNAKIDSQKAAQEPFANPAFAKEQRHFPTANPLDRLKMPKIMRKIIEKRLKKGIYTEGSPKKSSGPKSWFWQRFFSILILIVAAVLLVYWLQGTIGLAIAAIGIGSYWTNRGRIEEWQRRRKERMYEEAETRQAYSENPTDKSRDSQGRTTDSLGHVANKWTRRAISRFLTGLGLSFLTIIIGVLTIFSTVSSALSIFLSVLVLVGFGFTLVGVVNAIQGIVSNEPQSVWSWLVVILGIPFLLTLLLAVALAFA